MLKKLQTVLTQKKLDSFFITNPYNILYLTGFRGLSPQEREAYILATKRNAYLLTDGRYYVKLKSQSGSWRTKVKLITPQEGVITLLRQIINEEGIKTIAFEGDDLKFDEYQRLKEKLGAELIATERIIIKMRAIKEETEIVKIKRACQLSDQCLREIIPTIKIGQSEKEIAFRLGKWLQENDSETAFDSIVAIDHHSSIPHYCFGYEEGSNKVKNNSLILIDFGAKYQDYVSDITRIIFINPDSSKLKIYQQLLAAQKQTIVKLNLFSEPKAIDSFCRKMLQQASLPNYPHSTGHGVGLEVHEYPKISPLSTDTFYQNQVFTIEPAVYFKGKWGLRVEDTVVMGKNGVEVLTKYPKEALVIKS